MGAQPTSRAGIVFVALGLAVFGLVALVYFGFAGVGCEDGSAEDFKTVRCATEGADGWQAFQIVIICAGAATLLGGTAWSLAKRRMVGVTIGGVALIAGFVLAFAINYKEVDPAVAQDPPAPEPPAITGFELIDTQCQVPCAGGFRVSVVTNFDARLQAKLAPAQGVTGQRYRTLVNGEDAKGGFDSSRRDVFNVSGELLGASGERGPMPPGEYTITVSARPEAPGQQASVEIPPRVANVTVVP